MREDIAVSRAPVAAEILCDLGLEARVAFARDARVSSDTILFLGGSPLWYRGLLHRVAALAPAERPLVVVWLTEGLPMPAAAGLPREPLTLREVAKIVLRDRRANDHYSNSRYLRRLHGLALPDVLAVTNRAYQAYLAEHGIGSEHVPLGYHATYGRLLDTERDLDVVFLGEHRVRRRRRLLDRLEREGIAVTALGSSSSRGGIWGESRTQLLNRTKVLLNLPRYPGHMSDRILMGMATGALVVSEPLYLPDPFEPGVHYVESPPESLAATLRRYLADAGSRRRIAETGHRFLTEGLTLEASFSRLMHLVAARVEEARHRYADGA